MLLLVCIPTIVGSSLTIAGNSFIQKPKVTRKKRHSLGASFNPETFGRVSNYDPCFRFTVSKSTSCAVRSIYSFKKKLLHTAVKHFPCILKNKNKWMADIISVSKLPLDFKLSVTNF